MEQDSFTRLDRTLLKEVNDEGLIDLRPGAEQSYLGRTNRYLLIDRLKKLERMDLAHEVEPGRWSLSSGLEKTLRDLGERREIVATMHRAFERQGVARSMELYVLHKDKVTAPIIGRVVGKGLAGDELATNVSTWSLTASMAARIMSSPPSRTSPMTSDAATSSRSGRPRPAPEVWTGPSPLCTATHSASTTRASMSHKRARQ